MEASKNQKTSGVDFATTVHDFGRAEKREEKEMQDFLGRLLKDFYDVKNANFEEKDGEIILAEKVERLKKEYNRTWINFVTKRKRNPAKYKLTMDKKEFLNAANAHLTKHRQIVKFNRVLLYLNETFGLQSKDVDAHLLRDKYLDLSVSAFDIATNYVNDIKPDAHS